MKILQVMAGAPHGGAETAFVDMCIAMHEAGEQVEVVTRPNPARVGRLEEAGLKVHELRFGGAIDIFTMRSLKRIIEAFQPQIVQTWMSRASQKVPGWDESMKTPRYLVASRLGGYYKVKNFPRTDYFETITPDIKSFLVKNGVPEDRVRFIANFAEVEDTKEPVQRGSLSTPDDAPVLLALGRLHKSKALDTLLQAVAQVPEVYLWIAGEGPERKALEELCSALGLDERVRFLGWRDDRAALLEACDICVFPSRYEPFGTVFLQAWAHKRPLVVTDADGPRQFVRDGEDCLLVSVDDVQALAAAIGRLVRDKVLAAKLVEGGYKRYTEEFTREKSVAAYLDFYHEILRREGLSPAVTEGKRSREKAAIGQNE